MQLDFSYVPEVVRVMVEFGCLSRLLVASFTFVKGVV